MGVIGVEGAGVCGGFSASVAGVELAPAPALEVFFVGLCSLNQHETFTKYTTDEKPTFRGSLPSFLAFGFGLADCEGVAGAAGCAGDAGRPLVVAPAGALGGGGAIERCCGVPIEGCCCV